MPLSSPGDLPNPGIEPGSPVSKAASLPSKPILRWALNPMTSILTSEDTNTQARRRPLKDRGIVWNDAAASEEF